MQKSATLLHPKPLSLLYAPVLLLTLVLAARPAAAQLAAVPVKFIPQASHHPEFYSDARQSSEAAKEYTTDDALSVSVSPNPTQGKFFISLKGNPEERVRVTVTDKHGCIVDNHEVPAQANLQLGFWYFPGTYQLHVTQGGVTRTVKLEKLKEDL